MYSHLKQYHHKHLLSNTSLILNSMITVAHYILIQVLIVDTVLFHGIITATVMTKLYHGNSR